MEVGIDFGIDHHGRLWLIEVNTDDLTGGPDSSLFQQLPNQKYYHEIIKRNEKNNELTVKKVFEYYEKYVKHGQVE